jgi:acyl-CoA thioester hydrolase
MTQARAQPAHRSDFVHWSKIMTRWHDNDIYGHVNNVVYYSYFDTIVNEYAVSCGALDIHDGETTGIVVESGCRYHSPLAFPQAIDAGLRVEHLGRSSVRYAIGLFAVGEHRVCGRTLRARDGRPAYAQTSAYSSPVAPIVDEHHRDRELKK